MYKIHYPEIPNMGDLLNKDMIEGLFGVTVHNRPYAQCNMSGIGSSLGRALYSETSGLSRMKRMLWYPFTDELHIWGTGFLNAGEGGKFAYKQVNVHAVRGALTKKRVEGILGRELDIPLCDGGILAQNWVGYYPEKRHAVGIVPHFREKDVPYVEEMKRFYPDSVVIDLSGGVKDVVIQIAECETVISSSLHGLIIADSFHIPNIHVRMTELGDRIKGDGYKYRDYYSGFGLEDHPLIVSERKWPTKAEIDGDYRITAEAVEKKKQEMFDCFPKL